MLPVLIEFSLFSLGIESFSKLGDSIYFEEEGNVPGLYIIQYISSSINWKSGKIYINQKVEPAVSWDPRLQVTLTVLSKEVIFFIAMSHNFKLILGWRCMQYADLSY